LSFRHSGTHSDNWVPQACLSHHRR
jgi:hypothetical protein